MAAANVGSALETREAIALGGDGVGLLRSEFLFLGRDTAPTEEEQAKVSAGRGEIHGRTRPLVIRTLDVEAAARRCPTCAKDSPSRPAVRVSLDRPTFRIQLRAILRRLHRQPTIIMFR